MNTALVEFCGLPGTGKTTLAALTRQSLFSSGLTSSIVDATVSAATPRPVRVARRAAGVAATAAMHPADAARTARAVVNSRQGSARDTVAILAQWFAIQRLLTRARGASGVHLAEEGLVQTLWTLGLRSRRDVSQQLWTSVPEAARADLLVVVHAPLEVIVDRLASRSSRHSRTQQLTAAQQVRELERGNELLDRLTRLSGLSVLRLTNDEDATPEQLAAVVAARATALVAVTGQAV